MTTLGALIMNDPTLTPFQQHDASILETNVGTFIDMPEHQRVYWQPKNCQAIKELMPGMAYGMINACIWVRPAPID